MALRPQLLAPSRFGDCYGIQKLYDLPTMLIAITTIFALIWFKNIREPQIILIAALIGIILKLIL